MPSELPGKRPALLSGRFEAFHLYGVTLFVLLYWATQVPQLAPWQGVLDPALRTVAGGVALMLGVDLIDVVRGRWRRILKWISDRVEIEGSIGFRFGKKKS